jgi:hypothetical protein
MMFTFLIGPTGGCTKKKWRKSMLENPMVHGRGVYDNGQFDAPKKRYKPVEYTCPRCWCEIPLEQTVYEWDDKWICGDCLEDAIGSMSLYDLTEMSGEEECYTKQMLDGASSTEEKADVLYIEMSKAEEVA